MTRRVGVCQAVLTGLISSTLIATGCGKAAQKRQAQELQNASVLSKTAPLGDRLVKQAEINSTSDTEAGRTFLQLWSLLQFEAWDEAEQLFEPGLRSAIGASMLAAALENDLVVWQATKPQIISTHVTATMATISFLARNEQGNVLPTSISFGGRPGTWRVSYFSLLNPAIVRTTEQREQARIEPLGTKPNVEAVRRADDSAGIQGKYLESKLAAETAAPSKP